MQVFGLHKSIYKLNRLVKPEENFTSETLAKNHVVKTWQQLKGVKWKVRHEA